MEMKFKDVAELWKAEKSEYVKESTIAAYRTIMRNHLLPYFGDKDEVTEEDVQSFVLKKHSSGLSNKSLKDAVIVLKMILRYGHRKGIFTSHRMEVHYPIELRDNVVRTLTKSDQMKIMEYIEQHLDRLNLGIYICLVTGLRIGEICALRWEDVDDDSGVICVRRTLQRIYAPEDGNCRTKLIMDTPKTESSVRNVPVNSELLNLLKQVQNGRDKTEYILSGSSKPIEPRSYRNHYRKLLARLDIPELKFHGLRHTFATRCIESDCDYKTVSTLLGHANISTTLNLYVHPGMDQKRECIEKMFSSIFPANGGNHPHGNG